MKGGGYIAQKSCNSIATVWAMQVGGVNPLVSLPGALRYAAAADDEIAGRVKLRCSVICVNIYVYICVCIIKWFDLY